MQGQLALQFYERMVCFHRNNYNAKEEINELNHHVVVIMKRTVRCTENQSILLRANGLHVIYSAKWKYQTYNNYS